MSHPLQFLLLLVVIVTSAKLAGAASNRLGQPAVFGEILAGLVLGPTVLNILAWPVFAAHDAAHPALLAIVADLSELGVVLLMFIAGLETDLDEMRRVGSVAFWAAAGGVVLPFAGGAALAVAFGLPLFWEGLFIGTILTATSVSISAQTLLELGALRTREGTTILGAAVIDDVMGIVVLSLIVALARGGTSDLTHLGLVILRMTAYFAIALAARRVLAPIARWAEGLGVSQGLLAGVLVLALLYAWAAEYLGGVAAITGSYLAGVLFARTDLKARIDQGIHPLTYSILVPVFFVAIGLQADGRQLGGRIAFTLLLVAVAIVAKAVGAAGAARLFGFTGTESVRVGVGMISRGEVGLIVAGYGLGAGIIGQDVFSASVIMVLATTMVTPPLLRVVFPVGPGGAVRHVEETIAGPPEEADPNGEPGTTGPSATEG